MTTFEYLVQEMPADQPTQDIINRNGGNGWELVSAVGIIDTSYTTTKTVKIKFFFKQPLKSSPYRG